MSLPMSDPVDLAHYTARHFLWTVQDGVAVICLNRPERKNPLTFESYRELRDVFRALPECSAIRSVVLHGAGENFCSGGDVFDIIGPLTSYPMPQLLEFTRLTTDLIKAMLLCPQIIIAAVDGVCAGAGAMLALASDMRLATARSKTSFLFSKVGLAGCDMGACVLLPRMIGQGRAARLLYLGCAMSGEEGERWGFFQALQTENNLLQAAKELAREIARGPSFAHAMTKKMLQQEWNMGLDQALEAEAQAQALCMATQDFQRAFHAFSQRQVPQFQGN